MEVISKPSRRVVKNLKSVGVIRLSKAKSPDYQNIIKQYNKIDVLVRGIISSDNEDIQTFSDEEAILLETHESDADKMKAIHSIEKKVLQYIP